MDELKGIIRDSEDPFETGLRISLAGNIIDFGPATTVNEKIIEEAIKKSLSQKLGSRKVALLKNEIENAEKIYL